MVATGDIETWLSQNTFYCADIGARMKPEQCRTNREKAVKAEFPGMLYPCVTCDGRRSTAKEDEKMAPQYTCIEPGCDKHRVKNKRCAKHSRQYLARLDQEQAGDPKAPEATAPGGAEPEASASAEPNDGAQPEMRRSLLSLIKDQEPEERHGFFLDFTGREALFVKVAAMSDDPAADILRLIDALFAGDLLAARAGLFDEC